MATLTAAAPVGGLNRTYVWSESGGSASTLLFTFNQSETSEIVGDVLLNQLELTLANKIRNAAFLTFKQNALTAVNLAPFEVTMEDGNVVKGVNVPTGVTRLIVAHCDGQISGTSMVTAFMAVLTPDTGNHSRASGTLGDTPVKFTAIPANKVITIAGTKFYQADTTVWATTVATMSFNTDAYGCVAYQPVL
jgi:hypothetical protein